MTTGASVYMHLYTQNKQNVIKIILKTHGGEQLRKIPDIPFPVSILKYR